MLQDRNYRGEHVGAGRITDMDAATAQWFISRGWAKEAYEAPALTTTEADALIPSQGKRRRAIR
ncbi:MAG: hypothetical protein QG586_583 [Pseudomonadota bacterium]|nr:hypothetical protein [Pseudomonadota bacterium]